MQKNDSHEQHAHQNTQRERPYTVYDHKVAFLDAIFHEGTGQPIHVLNMGGREHHDDLWKFYSAIPIFTTPHWN